MTNPDELLPPEELKALFDRVSADDTGKAKAVQDVLLSLDGQSVSPVTDYGPANLLDLVRKLAAENDTLSTSAMQSSWAPADMAAVLAGDLDVAKPTLLERSDSERLIYGELLNGLHGESESGKTWVALFMCTQVMQAGGKVLYLDFESSMVDIASRLMALGVDAAVVVDCLTYIGPSDRYSDKEMRALGDLIASGQFEVIVLDGVTDAMNAFGLKPRDESDYAEFKRALLLPLTLAGGACVTIDHIARGSDGREALGTQHKRASIRGASFLVEVITPFARGQSGSARLVVSKDRPGWVRGVSERQQDRSIAGVFSLTATEDGLLVPSLVTVAEFNEQPVSFADLSARHADRFESELASLVAAIRANPGAGVNDLKEATNLRDIKPYVEEAVKRKLIVTQQEKRKKIGHYPLLGSEEV
ncbi:AAA family ATPase [Branchiibius sp. NY16-3462-2]|uniref:AAA family ATPase n=1 Tax=Branchiibius sp. NY16-3462-2 TaxID=1807500 RepID=UPI00079B34F5|nr:AAA family ATPase [Branchiibius sp. NY16-3462-2]KYH43237.1 hypothetical protein AZH51_12850 [Branchiibius sp. NY16-3462-2]